ncbi:maltose 6'-phosphate phosphatase [Neobacillus bataviensis]|uniref:Maltose 6'-phosphate phosphatase n=2 Tax=Neobacillus bataviensis TaxID=220685 RepID=A0A561DNN1_9BACI|nr:maltose 6'-phosphate phosphatase [Neobacillus bataviensis]
MVIMKLLTLNCHSWHEEHQLDKIAHLVDTIIENSYDVISLQEVSQALAEEYVDGKVKKNNYAYVLLQELKKRGNDEYSMVWDLTHYIKNGTYEEGVAILTKHPIIQHRSFFVSQSEDYAVNWKTRRIIGATIKYKDKPYTFYSCHMGWWHDEVEPFKAQADKMFKKLNWDESFFLMGDFNNDASLKGEGYEYLLSHGLYDTYNLAEEKDEGITVKGKIAGWSNNKQDLRIDLILTNQPAQVDFSKVIFNNHNKMVVSDHYGVEAKVNL